MSADSSRVDAKNSEQKTTKKLSSSVPTSCPPLAENAARMRTR